MNKMYLVLTQGLCGDNTQPNRLGIRFAFREQGSEQECRLSLPDTCCCPSCREPLGRGWLAGPRGGHSRGFVGVRGCPSPVTW